MLESIRTSIVRPLPDAPFLEPIAMPFCSRCKTPLTEEGRFCPACGTAVASAADTAEFPLTAAPDERDSRSIFAPGSVLDSRYRIIGMIGKGGMGEVYRAEDPRVRREVAIKVLPARLVADPERRRRFEHEARAAGGLNHPNIVTVHDVGAQNGTPYIVTELIEGESLRARLARGRLPVPRALRWAGEIADGLAAAHAHGIVHRDLKPDNLFVTRDDRVKILDFGLARLITRTPTEGIASESTTTTELGVILGTVGYMAPEQILGRPVDQRADLFAFGCVMFEMLSGHRAFAEPTATETLHAALHRESPVLDLTQPGITPAIAQIVSACLEKEPARRFESARDIAIALRAVGGEPMRSIDPTRRWSARVVAVSALLLAVVGTLAGLAIERFRSHPPPEYRRITFRRGTLWRARFGPGGQVVYSAAWDGNYSYELFASSGRSDTRPLGLSKYELLGVSSRGDLALRTRSGTLAVRPLGGGAPRELLENVEGADWSPAGDALAVTRSSGRDWQLEYPIGKVIYQSAVPISDPRVSPDGRQIAFVAHTTPGDTGGKIAVVDLDGRSRNLTGWWDWIGDPCWKPDGREVWFSSAQASESAAIRAVQMNGTARTVLSTPGSVSLRDISHDGRVLLVRWDARGEAYVRRPGDAGDQLLSPNPGLWLSDMTRDGHSVLMNDQGEGASKSYTAYLQPLDGTPGVRLFDGVGMTLSPDGKWVLAMSKDRKPPLMVQPTGPGMPRRLNPGAIETYSWADWFPDGRRIVLAGMERGKSIRCYVQDLAGGPPRPISPFGTGLYYPGASVTPDGRAVLIHTDTWKALLQPLDASTARPVSGPGIPMRWSPDGRLLYYFEAHGRVHRMNMRSGEDVLWTQAQIGDSAGIRDYGPMFISADGSTLAYYAWRDLMDLYEAQGLH